MNGTLKDILIKLMTETGSDWVVLPFVLYRVQGSPYTLGLTPFEIMFKINRLILPNLRSELTNLMMLTWLLLLRL